MSTHYCIFTGAINQHKLKSDTEHSTAELKADIENSVNHVFGSHDECRSYYCQRKDERNYLLEINQTAFYDKIRQYNKYLANNSRSLIFDVDSNAVEQFNAVVAKFVGGKRINYSLNKSYNARCSAAVVSFNCKRPHYALHKTLTKTSPGKNTKLLELRRIKHNSQNLLRRKLRQKYFKTKERKVVEQDTGLDYGENCQKPDLPLEELEKEKEEFLRNLQKTDEERYDLERQTILQGDSGRWLEERRKIITASNFHRICRKRPNTTCKNIVRNLLYDSKTLNVASLMHGRNYEENAKKKLEQQLNIKVEPCGLFIKKDIQYLGK